MNLYFRLLWVVLSALWKPRITDIFTTGFLTLRVLPNDLDTNLHMNNGRYMTVMDLGRLDLILRNGLLGLTMREKAIPVLSASQMRFRTQLELWRKYSLETHVVCWDEKWVYMEQRFIILDGKKAGQVAAIGLLKGAFYSRKTKTTIPTSDLLEKLNMSSDSPEFPDHIKDWVKAEEGLRDYVRGPSS